MIEDTHPRRRGAVVGSMRPSRNPTPMEESSDFSDSDSSRSSTPTRPNEDDYGKLKEDNRRLREENAILVAKVQELTDRLEAMEEANNRRHQDLMTQLAAFRDQASIRAAPVAAKPLKPSAAPAVAAATKPGAKRKKVSTPIASDDSEDDSQVPKATAATTQKLPEVATPKAAPETATPPPAETAEKEPPQTKTSPKIPPVILREQNKWPSVQKRMDSKGIKFVRAKLTKDGVAITPTTPSDYRLLTRMLTDDKIEYHTYTLPEDRRLRVVIRGIPDGIRADDVAAELQSQGFDPLAVNRMTSRRTGKAMPLVLVQVPVTEERILELNRCCSLAVRVERQHAKTGPTQCHRCQRFGHAQSRCTAAAKCVKCGGAHHSGDCKKTREEPAKCANCGGAHPASYRGCPEYQRTTARKPTSAHTAKIHTVAATQQQKQGEPKQPQKAAASYAEAAKPKQSAATRGAAKPRPAGDSIDLAAAAATLARLQEMCTAMSSFLSQATLFQV